MGELVSLANIGPTHSGLLAFWKNQSYLLELAWEIGN